MHACDRTYDGLHICLSPLNRDVLFASEKKKQHIRDKAGEKTNCVCYHSGQCILVPYAAQGDSPLRQSRSDRPSSIAKKDCKGTLLQGQVGAQMAHSMKSPEGSAVDPWQLHTDFNDSSEFGNAVTMCWRTFAGCQPQAMISWGTKREAGNAFPSLKHPWCFPPKWQSAQANQERAIANKGDRTEAFSVHPCGYQGQTEGRQSAASSRLGSSCVLHQGTKGIWSFPHAPAISDWHPHLGVCSMYGCEERQGESNMMSSSSAACYFNAIVAQAYLPHGHNADR
eukprot:1159872-Pelagomonas_calceolata.AAC.3